MTSVPLFDLIIDQFLNPEATMTKQGDLSLLDDPVAQTLLHSTSLARLAYVWRDDTPRVVPIWFHWTGNEIVMGTPSKAPKLKVLRNNSSVALTIDSNTWPYKVLGTAGQDPWPDSAGRRSRICRRR